LLLALAIALAPTPLAAELLLPPGFTAEVYVTGHGFDPASERGVAGFPAAGTLAVDPAGILYVAKTGARFRSGEVDDLGPIYRFSTPGTRLTPETEARFFHGPPLRNPQVGLVRGPADVLVTTYDRDRQVGALYRLLDGRATLFAGGTPPRGTLPVFKHPDGVAADSAGRLYVADREQGVVVRLDAAGKLLDPQYLRVGRPRFLAIDERDTLWVAGDGSAETPFRDGAGQIVRATSDGAATVVVEGPLTAGISLSPGGALFVAQRRASRIFALTPGGKRIDFADVSEGSYLRGLAFAPVTPATQRAGIAGDLFVIAISRQVWAINEVIRISGPFDAFLREKAAE
jgi:hypothetical protein